MLRGEGERLSNEILRYATLNDLTMTVMRSVADRLRPSKGTENGHPPNVVVQLGRGGWPQYWVRIVLRGTAEGLRIGEPALSRRI